MAADGAASTAAAATVNPITKAQRAAIDQDRAARVTDADGDANEAKELWLQARSPSGEWLADVL